MLHMIRTYNSRSAAQRLCLSTLGILSCAAMVALPASAQTTTTDTWVSGTTGNWSVGGNWVGGLVPASGTTTALTFNSTTNTPYTSTNDLASPFVLNSLTLNNTNATPTNGLITLAGNALAFGGTNPAITFNGTGNSVIDNNVSFTATSVIGGTGSGTLTFAGTVDTGTSPTTINNLSVDNTGGGTVNFNGNVTLNPLTPASSDHQGGSFFATNGTVNVAHGTSFVANNLVYVGDSISSITSLTNGGGTTSAETSNATLNINGLVTQNGRFSIAAFTSDKGVVNVNSGGVLNVFNGDTTDPSFFSGRLQIGGFGGNGTSAAGTANATANSATLNVNGGVVNGHNITILYTNGAININSGGQVTFAAIGDGGSAPSVNGVSISGNSALYLISPSGTTTYSGGFKDDGTTNSSTIFKQGAYTQTFAGTSTYAGNLMVQGGTLNLTGSFIGNNNSVVSQDGVAGDAVLNVSGSLGGSVTQVGLAGASTPGTLNVTGSGAINSTTTTLIGGAINVSGSGTINGTTTNINGGILTLASGSTAAINSTANTNASGGTLNIGTGTSVNSATTTITGGSTVNDAGTITSSSTVVSSGTLAVTGTASTSGTVTVQASGGTLTGNGTVGAIQLQAGVISPGTTGTGNGATDLATLNGTSLTWTSGATMNYGLNLSSVSSDQIDLTTFFDTATPGSGTYLFNFTTTGTFAGSSEQFDLVHFATGQTNFTASNFSANGIPSGFNGVFTLTNNDLFFSLDALPEPSALPLLLGGGATLGAITLRRLRRKKTSA